MTEKETVTAREDQPMKRRQGTSEFPMHPNLDERENLKNEGRGDQPGWEQNTAAETSTDVPATDPPLRSLNGPQNFQADQPRPTPYQETICKCGCRMPRHETEPPYPCYDCDCKGFTFRQKKVAGEAQGEAPRQEIDDRPLGPMHVCEKCGTEWDLADECPTCKVCSCLEFWDSHHPECPTLARVETGAHPSQDARTEFEKDLREAFPFGHKDDDLFLVRSDKLGGIYRRPWIEQKWLEWHHIWNIARSTPSLPAQDATIQKLWQLRDDVEMFIQHDGEIGSIDYNASKTFQSRHRMMQTAVQLRGKSGGSTPSPDTNIKKSTYCDIAPSPDPPTKGEK